MTADEHPTKISAPQSAAAKRTIIKLAPGLAPQMWCLIGGAARVLAAEMGLFLDLESSVKAVVAATSQQKSVGSRCSCREKQEQSIKKILISVGFVLAFAAPGFA
jgi:hypothetical protein